jgi:GxxExxY protein
MFSAFIQTASKEVDVQTEVKHSVNNHNYRLDMLVNDENEKVIIELKRSSINPSHSHEDQLMDYLSSTKIEHGILWYPRNVSSSEYLDIETMTNWGNEVNYTTIIK